MASRGVKALWLRLQRVMDFAAGSRYAAEIHAVCVLWKDMLYLASKAAPDHLACAYHHTYGLPVLTTNCSNNYGPCHFPEKLIPLMIVDALADKTLPMYRDGLQVQDSLNVQDHCRAIRRVIEAGRQGETHSVGGRDENPNTKIVHSVCGLLDELRPNADGRSYKTQLVHMRDRRGHDRPYPIDARKIELEVLSLEEKPKQPHSSYAVTGLYFYDHQVVDLVKSLKPSARGKLDSTDLNRLYLNQGQPNAKIMGRGYAWLDAGTHKSQLDASQFIATLENCQGLKVAWPEAIDFRQRWIKSAQLETLAQPLFKSHYAKHLAF